MAYNQNQKFNKDNTPSKENKKTPNTWARGERNGRCKITAEIAKFIKETPTEEVNHRQMVKIIRSKFQVEISRYLVSGIRRGMLWKEENSDYLRKKDILLEELKVQGKLTDNQKRWWEYRVYGWTNRYTPKQKLNFILKSAKEIEGKTDPVTLRKVLRNFDTSHPIPDVSGGLPLSDACKSAKNLKEIPKKFLNFECLSMKPRYSKRCAINHLIERNLLKDLPWRMNLGNLLEDLVIQYAGKKTFKNLGLLEYPEEELREHKEELNDLLEILEEGNWKEEEGARKILEKALNKVGGRIKKIRKIRDEMDLTL